MSRKKSLSPSFDTPNKKVEQGIFWLPNDAPWGGFVNIKLTDEQAEEFKIWFDGQSDEIAEYLAEIGYEGMKFGSSYDREHQCWVVTFTGALMEKRDTRCCCTSRAGTMLEAWGLAVWKHAFLALGDYGMYRPKTGTMLSWG